MSAGVDSIFSCLFEKRELHCMNLSADKDLEHYTGVAVLATIPLCRMVQCDECTRRWYEGFMIIVVVIGVYVISR